MVNKTSLIGLMLVVGAMPVAMISALPVDTNGCDPATDWETIHYYTLGGGFTIWQNKEPDRLVILGAGFVDVEDGCFVASGGAATDDDFEWGIGGANLPVNTVPACRAVTGHHNTVFYVDDLVGELLGSSSDPADPFRGLVTGSAGADGDVDATGASVPCGNGIIAPRLEAKDCLAPFWGKGPHTACGVGADGSYWVFVNIATVDLDNGTSPQAGASTLGCIWTGNFGGKEVKPCSKYL